MARNRITREASEEVTQGLQNAGTDPRQHNRSDARNITFAQLRPFEADARVLQDLQRPTAERSNRTSPSPTAPKQAGTDFVLPLVR